MKDGEICIFQIPHNNDFYRVKCECYESLYDGQLAYGNTYYRNGEEILHAGYGEEIDTLEKAREHIESTIKLREQLLKNDWYKEAE